MSAFKRMKMTVFFPLRQYPPAGRELDVMAGALATKAMR